MFERGDVKRAARRAPPTAAESATSRTDTFALKIRAIVSRMPRERDAPPVTLISSKSPIQRVRSYMLAICPSTIARTFTSGAAAFQSKFASIPVAACLGVISASKYGNARRAFPYCEAEITPKHDATGIEANFNWDVADAATKVRAIVEGQIANMYERTRWIGDFEEIKVTGGASRSKGIRETIASIFKAKVTTLDVADSAAVGGARLAAKGMA